MLVRGSYQNHAHNCNDGKFLPVSTRTDCFLFLALARYRVDEFLTILFRQLHAIIGVSGSRIELKS